MFLAKGLKACKASQMLAVNVISRSFKFFVLFLRALGDRHQGVVAHDSTHLKREERNGESGQIIA